MSGIAVRAASEPGSGGRSRGGGGSWWVLLRAWVAGLAVLAGVVVPIAVATPAAAQTGTFAYVANSLADTVSVIDIANNTVIATVPVGSLPNDVAVTPDGSRVYVANAISDNVSVIDAATNTVTATVTVGDGPTGVAIGTVTTERTPTKLTLKAKKKDKDKEHPEGGDGLTLTAKLTAEGLPLEGKDIITFTNAILLCTETTDERGKATCKVPGKQAKDTCYTATFAGDDTYLPSTVTLCKKRDDYKPDLLSQLPSLSDVPVPALSPLGASA